MATPCLLAYRPTLLACSCFCGASGAQGCSGRMQFSMRARTAQSARWKGSSASGSSAGRQQGPARTHSTIASDAENRVACRGNEWRKSVLCTGQWKRTLDERATCRGERGWGIPPRPGGPKSAAWDSARGERTAAESENRVASCTTPILHKAMSEDHCACFKYVFLYVQYSVICMGVASIGTKGCLAPPVVF